MNADQKNEIQQLKNIYTEDGKVQIGYLSLLQEA